MRTPPIPGPWHYETTPQGNVTVYATRSGPDDKIIIGVSQFGSLEQREANARLIAAAPDLYVALETLLASFLASTAASAEGIAVSWAKDALAKARGEQVSA